MKHGFVHDPLAAIAIIIEAQQTMWMWHRVSRGFENPECSTIIGAFKSSALILDYPCEPAYSTTISHTREPRRPRTW